jgi:hypothetical protein
VPASRFPVLRTSLLFAFNSGAVACDAREIFVNCGVVGQFGMKRGRKDAALADKNRMTGIFGENFDVRADSFDDGSADEDHFQRLGMQLGFSHMDVAGKLAAVAVAKNRGVEERERGLRGAVNFFCEENCASAGAEERAFLRGKLFQGVEEAFCGHHFQVRGAFAAGEDDAVESLQVLRRADEGVVNADALKHLGVGFVITLDG